MRILASGLILAAVLAWSAAYPAEQVEVVRKATIRDQPRGTARAVVRVKGGTFELLSSVATNGWYEIRVADGTGWIYSRSVRLLHGEESKIVLASFNTLHLGWGQTKSIETVAAVVGRFDLVALLEVMKPSVLAIVEDELERVTSVDWQWTASEALGRNSYKEHSAFLWRTDRVQLIPESMHTIADPDDRFLREPVVADFRAGTFDFAVMAVHLVFGGPSDRAMEAEEIARAFETVQGASPEEGDLLLVGDFNLEPEDEAWADLKALPGMNFVIRPPTKTSLSDDGPVHLYDNVWFRAETVREYDRSAGAYDFVEDMFDGDYASGRRVVSDHLPVWARFRTDGEDDD